MNIHVSHYIYIYVLISFRCVDKWNCWVIWEKTMAPHSSTLAWKIPWMEESGRLPSMASLRVRHDWATSLSLSCTGEGNGNPLQCSCLENPRDGGAWWPAVYGVAQSQTWLKRLSSMVILEILRIWKKSPASYLKYTILHSHQQRIRVPISPHSLQHVLLYSYFTIVLLVGVKWYLIVVYLHFPYD